MKKNIKTESLIKYEQRQFLYDIYCLIDCNTHILSEVDDDGPIDIDEATKMLEYSKERNIRYICVTPHYRYNKEDIDEFLKRRAKSFEALEDIKDVYLGACIKFFKGISNFKRLKDLCIGHSDYLLIEMPYVKWDEEIIDELLSIIEKGFTPIIAHFERYLPFNRLRKFKYLRANGCIMQANSEYFCSKNTKKDAIKIFNKGYVDIIASDCHNSTDRRQTLPDALIIVIQNSKESYLYQLLNRYEQVCEKIVQ